MLSTVIDHRRLNIGWPSTAVDGVNENAALAVTVYHYGTHFICNNDFNSKGLVIIAYLNALGRFGFRPDCSD